MQQRHTRIVRTERPVVSKPFDAKAHDEQYYKRGTIDSPWLVLLTTALIMVATFGSAWLIIGVCRWEGWL